MTIPKIQFLNDQDMLANYLCYLGKQISCHYYQDRRFLVLAKPLHYGRSVYFPDLVYPTSFWNAFKYLTANDYVYDFPKVIKTARELLCKAKISSSEEKMRLFESRWSKKERAFFEFLREFLPSYDLKKIEGIVCLVSPFGTMGTFHFDPLPNGKYVFHLTSREDLDISHMAEKILTLFLHIENPHVTLTTWEQRESIVDFLMTKTKFAEIFDHKFVPTVSEVPEIAHNLALESDQFLASLGFPVKPILGIQKENDEQHLLTINDRTIYNTFTPSEKRILFGLIGERKHLLTYDQIGDLFWGEEESLEKFSLQSIAKIMEKIRKKLKNHGIYQELIYTVRGEGYVLYD